MPGLLGSGIAVRVHTPIRFADDVWDDDSFLPGRQSNTGLGPGGGAIVPANLHRVQPARIRPSEWTVPIPTPPQRRNKIEEAFAASRMRDAKSTANKAGEKKTNRDHNQQRRIEAARVRVKSHRCSAGAFLFGLLPFRVGRRVGVGRVVGTAVGAEAGRCGSGKVCGGGSGGGRGGVGGGAFFCLGGGWALPLLLFYACLHGPNR